MFFYVKTSYFLRYGGLDSFRIVPQKYYLKNFKLNDVNFDVGRCPIEQKTRKPVKKDEQKSDLIDAFVNL